jgi:hypothetical protein
VSEFKLPTEEEVRDQLKTVREGITLNGLSRQRLSGELREYRAEEARLNRFLTALRGVKRTKKTVSPDTPAKGAM